MDFDWEFVILPAFSFFASFAIMRCAKLLLDGADKCCGAQQPELGDALAKNPVQFSRHFCQEKELKPEQQAAT